jgi:hypothetical protein
MIIRALRFDYNSLHIYISQKRFKYETGNKYRMALYIHVVPQSNGIITIHILYHY